MAVNEFYLKKIFKFQKQITIWFDFHRSGDCFEAYSNNRCHLEWSLFIHKSIFISFPLHIYVTLNTQSHSCLTLDSNPNSQSGSSLRLLIMPQATRMSNYCAFVYNKQNEPCKNGIISLFYSFCIRTNVVIQKLQTLTLSYYHLIEIFTLFKLQMLMII